MKIFPFILTGFAIGALALSSHSQTAKNDITVRADQLVAKVEPTMWGVFFEDINLGADGGIYAELVKNRSFEFYKPMMGWKVLGKPLTEGDFLVVNRQAVNAPNPRFLCVTLHNNKKGTLGLNNEGFRGMGIKKGLGYDFSIMYRLSSPDVKMYIELINEKGETIGNTIVTANNSHNEWKKIKTNFTATATVPKSIYEYLV